MMKVHYGSVSIRLSLAVVLVLVLLVTACTKPVTGTATPAPQETTVNIPDVNAGGTATVESPVDSVATATAKPPVGQTPTEEYPAMPATPVITVTIEAYPTP
ncbi:MAG: hypothetical protein ACYCZF_05945 [Anaerolineae bacterium]